MSFGVEHRIGKKTYVYSILSATNNDSGAQFGLSQGGIQDVVIVAAPGNNVKGVSVGMVHKF